MTQFVYLECMGNLPGPYWLDGRTTDSTVGLASTIKPPCTGTLWEVVPLDDGSNGLKCMGDIQGSRWLDGITATGNVGLAPQTDGSYSGTHWLIHMSGTAPNATATLKCLGTGSGDARFLDGRTADGRVGLALNTNPPFTGTQWRVMQVS